MIFLLLEEKRVTVFILLRKGHFTASVEQKPFISSDLIGTRHSRSFIPSYTGKRLKKNYRDEIIYYLIYYNSHDKQFKKHKHCVLWESNKEIL